MDVAGHLPGLPGLFLAGLVSAALATMSASLNTVSGTIYEDFVNPWIPDSPKKEAMAANIMKVSDASSIINIIFIVLSEEIFFFSPPKELRFDLRVD